MVYPSVQANASISTATVGEGFIGALAHPTIYEGALAQSLLREAVAHGPNLPTLAHQLAAPVPYPLLCMLGSQANLPSSSSSISQTVQAEASSGIHVVAHFSAAACSRSKCNSLMVILPFVFVFVCALFPLLVCSCRDCTFQVNMSWLWFRNNRKRSVMDVVRCPVLTYHNLIGSHCYYLYFRGWINVFGMEV